MCAQTPGWSRATALAGVAAASAGALLYAPVLMHLVRQWIADENYSHGLVVTPIAVAIAWSRRRDLLAPKPATAAGVATAMLGLALLIVGTRASDLYLPRLSIIVVAAGVLLWLGGWHVLRRLALPLGLVALTIPLPSLVFAQLTGSLQQQAAALGAWLLDVSGISVLRQGNVLVVPGATLEVVDACSGIRSLFALVTAALLLGHWRQSTLPWRLALVGVVVPVVLVVNALRVAFLGWSSQEWGPDALRGWPHTVSGYGTVICGALVLYGLVRLQPLQQFLRRGAHDSAAV